MNKFYKISCGLLMALSSAPIFAQLYVSPTSYVYVDDRMVFVNQDINLRPTGNIFLRNEAQLLQGKLTVASGNQGGGKLSVFQEGTVNNFAYNYWCAPVGDASVSGVGNENFSVSMLNRPTGPMASTAAGMLGAGIFDGTASPFAIADRWVFSYFSNTTYAAWAPKPGNAGPNLIPGYGYTLKGSSNTDAAPSSFTDNGVFNNPGSAQRYDFRGKPNDGDVTVFVGAGLRTLTGNPYPSAIDLRKYLEDASATDKVAYFWEQDPGTNSHLLAAYRGGYGTYSPLLGPIVAPYGNMGIYVPPSFLAYDANGNPIVGSYTTGTTFNRRFCPIGQGFMIEGDAGGNVTMKNDYRVYIKEGFYSDFNRNANGTNSDGFLPEIQSVSGFDYTTVSTAEVPQIRFNTLLNNVGIKQTALVFMDGASDGPENGMDAKAPEVGDVDMYFVLDNKEYVISVIEFDVNKKVPVGFKANIPSSFSVHAAELINFDAAENIYLHDKVTDVYHDIKNADYEFNLPAGVTNDTYEITFVDGQALSIPELASDAFGVYQNNDIAQLTIANPKMIDIKNVSLYDMTGKLIFNKANLGVKTSYQFPTTGIAEAVYIVKIITTDSQQFAKKITVHHSGK